MTEKLRSIIKIKRNTEISKFSTIPREKLKYSEKRKATKL